MRPPFEFIDHTADYAMRAWGQDLRELVENACRGLIHLTADVTDLRADEAVDICVDGDDREALLVHALKELLLLREEGALPLAVQVTRASPAGAHLRVGVADLNAHLERLRSAVKAVTYHDLAIVDEDGGLSVEIVFDT